MKKNRVSPQESLQAEFPDIPGIYIKQYLKGAGQNVDVVRGLIRDHLGLTVNNEFIIDEFVDPRDDLFDNPGHLCFEISADLTMFTGHLEKAKKMFGTLQFTTEPLIVVKDGDRFVYYLVTRQRYFNVADDLERSLEQLRVHIQQHNVHSVSMPHIGHKLEWPDIRQLLVDTFSGTRLKIKVYI